MADGKTHEADSVAIAIPLGLIIGGLTGEIPLGLAAGIGCFCGVILTPDLDVDTSTRSKAKMVAASPLGWLWVFYWYPYAKAIKHRAWISHLPIIGTIIRVLYLFAPFILGAVVLQLNGLPILESAWVLRPLLVPQVMAWGLGLSMSDLVHWIRDGAPIVGQTIEIRA